MPVPHRQLGHRDFRDKGDGISHVLQELEEERFDLGLLYREDLKQNCANAGISSLSFQNANYIAGHVLPVSLLNLDITDMKELAEIINKHTL